MHSATAWLAVPAANSSAFEVSSASTDGSAVEIVLEAGRAWADGSTLTLDAKVDLRRDLLRAPVPITAGLTGHDRRRCTRPRRARRLGGHGQRLPGSAEPDRARARRTGYDRTNPGLRQSQTAADRSQRRLQRGRRRGRRFRRQGKLTVSPAPVLTITGDCPLEAGGGYTGLEHYLYRVEVAEPDAAGRARFKWSQWNGGLVGRGLFAAGVPGPARSRSPPTTR